MGSFHFKTYVSRLNHLHMVELVDAYTLRQQRQNIRASLVANPLTGRPYSAATQTDNS